MAVHQGAATLQATWSPPSMHGLMATSVNVTTW